MRPQTGDPRVAPTGSEGTGGGGSCLVLGLGNDILTDDRVGLAVVRRLRELVGDAAAIAEAPFAGPDLISLVTGYERLIIVDAVWGAGHQPGTILHGTADDPPPGLGYRSPHSMALAELLAAGRELGLEMPTEVTIHAVAVDDPFRFGEEMTAAVAEAAERLAQSLRECLRPM